MANFNSLIKRKQYLWLGLILVGGAGAVAGGLYLSDQQLQQQSGAACDHRNAGDRR